VQTSTDREKRDHRRGRRETCWCHALSTEHTSRPKGAECGAALLTTLYSGGCCYAAPRRTSGIRVVRAGASRPTMGRRVFPPVEASSAPRGRFSATCAGAGITASTLGRGQSTRRLERARLWAPRTSHPRATLSTGASSGKRGQGSVFNLDARAPPDPPTWGSYQPLTTSERSLWEPSQSISPPSPLLALLLPPPSFTHPQAARWGCRRPSRDRHVTILNLKPSRTAQARRPVLAPGARLGAFPGGTSPGRADEQSGPSPPSESNVERDSDRQGRDRQCRSGAVGPRSRGGGLHGTPPQVQWKRNLV
jgi:hypothetical protein